MPTTLSIQNQLFGCIIALEPTDQRESNGSIIWKCQCTKCNSELLLSTKALKRSLYNECPECSKKKELGKVYGQLTVKEYYPNKKIGHNWLCECSCGNTTVVSTARLHSGHTLSCGCLQKKISSENSLVDMTGQKIGRWTVLSKGKTSSSSRAVKWLCECDCEKHTRREIAGTELRRGTSLSCGCLRESHGEYKISQLLNDANLYFESEKKFDTCILPSGIQARFDFFVDNKYLIEFDGIQHFSEIHSEFFANSLDEIQERDEYKNNWCKENNIPLIRIPYSILPKLTIQDLLLETSQYLI